MLNDKNMMQSYIYMIKTVKLYTDFFKKNIEYL